MPRFTMPPRKNKDKKQPQIPPGGYVDAANNRQRKANKAGLLVTDELQKAIDRCKAKVEKLAGECLRGNRKFRDIEFDIIEDRDRCLHALNTEKPKYSPADIRRVTDIFENPQFFVDGATASDISQGALGDCWFLSALAVAGTRGLVEKICVARNEKVGIYGFIFYRDGGWVDVIVDDLLFTKVPRWEALTSREQMLYHSDKKKYDKTARKGSKNLLFAKSRTDNETWVPLIEKAFAKLHGDYASLEAGYTSEGVEDLTGAVSTIMYVQDLLDTDQYWKDELMRVGVDRLFACFIPSLDFITGGDTSEDATPAAPQTNGLIMSHAYGIIKAVEFREMRFLRIRNPWGESEWTGPWSDGSKEWNVEWGTELLKALDYEFGDDGEFIMEYSDFLETWAIIERSRLFDEDWVMSQQWLNVTTGSYLNAWNYGDVSYSIKVDKPTPAVIVLAQLDQRYFEEFSGHYRWSLDFAIYAKPAPTSGSGKASPTGEVMAPTQPPVAAESLGSAIHSSLWDRSVKMEVKLPRAGEYVVQVRIDRSQKRNKDFLQENASQWSGRKYARKYAEYVQSRSIAANFDPASQGAGLILPAETYTDKTLTDLEIEALDQIHAFRAHKLELFPPKKPEETADEAAEGEEAASEASSEEDDAKKPKDFASEKVDHDTIPPPDKDDEKAAEEETTEKKDEKKDEDRKTCEGPAEDGKEDAEASGEKDNGEAKGEDEDEENEAVTTEDGEDGEEEEEAAGEPEKPEHEGFYCNGCRGKCIGTRYHCVDVTCPDFDYCSDCMEKGLHPPDHKFIALTADADDELTRGDAEEDRDVGNQLTVGLRVYTKKDAPATITGQLRNGTVIRESIVMSKVLTCFGIWLGHLALAYLTSIEFECGWPLTAGKMNYSPNMPNHSIVQPTRLEHSDRPADKLKDRSDIS
ncbi:hypothetical protein FRB95_014777 [Tulasnella sp. JGI-2019a]|nr:hypothetical protein FRB95_014777 [Tulasnella sp. JGI-2019a]